MSDKVSIKGEQVDVSNPERTVIHNGELAESLKTDWQTTVDELGGFSPVAPHSVAVDEFGRVIVFDREFTKAIRKSLEQFAANPLSVNACGCEKGNCYKCGGK